MEANALKLLSIIRAGGRNPEIKKSYYGLMRRFGQRENIKSAMYNNGITRDLVDLVKDGSKCPKSESLYSECPYANSRKRIENARKLLIENTKKLHESFKTMVSEMTKK